MTETKDAIQILVGKTFKCVTEVADELVFSELDSSVQYKFYHRQDCCELVSIEDIIGDLSDLEYSPILVAEERTNSETHPAGKPKESPDESFTWTFYTFRTIKGTVTVRWYGESNGYYSESVDFAKIEEEDAADVSPKA